jgi:hypothetical protein
VLQLHASCLTMGVKGRSGLPYWRASPKSQILSSPLLLYSRLLVLRSLWMTQCSCR